MCDKLDAHKTPGVVQQVKREERGAQETLMEAQFVSRPFGLISEEGADRWLESCSEGRRLNVFPRWRSSSIGSF